MFRRPPPRPAGPRQPIELSQFRRLLAYVRPYRIPFAIGILAVAIAGSLGLVFPQFIGRFVDSIVGSSSFAINHIVILLLALFVIQAVFNFLRVYMLAQVGNGVVADLRTSVYRHLIYLPVRFFESRKTGEITSRLTSDVGQVQSLVAQAMAQIVNQSVQMVGSVILLFVTNLRLTLVMLAVVPVAVLAAAFFGSRLRKLSTHFQDKIADANADAEESIAGVRVVQSFTAEAFEVDRYASKIQESYRLSLRLARYRAFFISGIMLAMFSAISFVLWYGATLVVSGALSTGDLVAFLIYTFFVAGAVGSFTSLYSQLQEGLGASKRIFDLLDVKSDLPETGYAITRASVRGDVRFEGVSFRYGDRGNELVLEDINLEARPGQVIALVGPSGAGKSTLVTLIPRFYDPTTGRILLDDVDLRELDLRALRSHIGIVPQETQLFSGTIADNIRYGRPNATSTEIQAAANAANAHDFIMDFPDGYDTVVGERGVKLSGGQRQRVAIARALLKNPRVLILDEATSSLDSESEALVQAALDTLMRGRTTFVIAHRLSTVRNADRILVIAGGRITQQGNHDALMAQGGLYRDLYERQFKDVETTAGLPAQEAATPS